MPTLRDVQHALAREHGFAGWTALKDGDRVAIRNATGATALARYETMADALLDAYRTGTPEAMERHYRYTWHRRAWQAMRTYVQLDLGKRPTGPDDDVEITLDDARYLVAREHGFANWERSDRRSSQALRPAGRALAAKPVRLVIADAPERSRTDRELARLGRDHPRCWRMHPSATSRAPRDR